MGVSVPSPARSRNASILLSNVFISVHVEKFTTSALGGSSSAKYVSGPLEGEPKKLSHAPSLVSVALPDSEALLFNIRIGSCVAQFAPA